MMIKQKKTLPILMAEDDEDDRLLALDAFEEIQLLNDLYIVENGEELLDFLYHRGAYAEPKSSPRPGIILLDLNMPKKDGREALLEIKSDPHLRSIPIIVLTTSKEEEDICRSYESGVSSFIVKPVKFDDLVNLMNNLGKYWFEIVELPPDENHLRQSM